MLLLIAGIIQLIMGILVVAAMVALLSVVNAVHIAIYARSMHTCTCTY